MPSETRRQRRSQPPHAELGLLIKRARQRAGYRSQKELADKLGVNRVSVAEWERGVSYPVRHAGAIEALLEITIPARPAA